MTSELLEKLKQYGNATESYCRQVMEQKNVAPSLVEAMSYSLFAGGKRVRPALVLATCEALGKDAEIGIPAAAALEMVHTYSLIHDDLPAMDNDSLRRGKPTNHIQFGEGLAILAGDGLLTLAFELLTDANWSVSALAKLRMVKELALGAGSEGMVGGQVLDLAFENKPCTPEELKKIHVHKTGKLLETSVLMGAICSEASESAEKNLRRFGQSIGLAFQIADDILDLTADTKDLGKDAGSDLKKNKSTFVSVFGLQRSRQMCNELLEESLTAIADLGASAHTLHHLARYIIERKN